MSAGNSINATLIGLTTVTVRSVEGVDQPGRGSEVRPYKTITYALANTTFSANTLYLIDCFGEFVETLPAIVPNIIFNGNGGSLKVNNALSLAGSWAGVSGVLMFNGFSNALDFLGGVSLNFSSSPSSMFKVQDCFITKEVAAWNITGNASNQNKSGIYIDYLPGMAPSITQTNMIILNSNTLFSASAPLVLTGTDLSITQSSASTNGFLSSTDWTTFNSKQPSGSYITALTSDVSASGPGSAVATVNSVGGQTAANVASATVLANASTNLNTPNTIARRDGSGNFSAGTITASLSGNASTATTAVSFSGSLAGDVSGTQSATVIGAGVVTNAKLATMAPLTFKANNLGVAGPAKDITVAEAQAMLSTSGTITIGLNQIAFGDSGNNLIGTNSLTFNQSTNLLNIGNGPADPAAIVQITATAKMLIPPGGTVAQRGSMSPTTMAGLYYDYENDQLLVWKPGLAAWVIAA